MFDESEENELRNLMNLMIRKNIDNEFEAYSLSIITYKAVKDKWLIPPSENYDELIESLMRGDSYFAQYIYQSRFSYPFFRIRRDFNRLNSQLVGESQEKLKLELQFARANRIISELELLYLDEVERYFGSLKDNYSSLVRDYTPIEFWKGAQELIRKKGRFNLGAVDDPYAVFSSRVGTLTVLRYKQYLGHLVGEYYNKNFDIAEHMLGVLDLGAFSENDLKIIGYKFSNPTQLSNANLDSMQQKLKEHFIQQSMRPEYYDIYNPENKALIWDSALRSKDAPLYFHLSEFYYLLQESVPGLYQSLQGTVNVFEKLVVGSSVEHLSSERRSELEEMTRNIFDQAEDLSSEMLINEQILTGLSLTGLPEFSVNDRVTELAGNLLKLVNHIRVDLSQTYQFKTQDGYGLDKLPIAQVSAIDEDLAYSSNRLLIDKSERRSFKRKYKKSRKTIDAICATGYLACLNKLFELETMAAKYYCKSSDSRYSSIRDIKTYTLGDLKLVCSSGLAHFYKPNSYMKAIMPVMNASGVFLRGNNTPLIPLRGVAL